VSARLFVACALVAWFGAAPASAQVVWTPEKPRRGSIEIGGGLSWAGAFDVDSLPANLTANAGNQAPPFVLFNTETRVGGVSGLQARIGLFVTPSVAVEARVTYNRPVVSVRVFDDFEGAPGLTAEQTMSRYGFDGSVVLYRGGAGARRAVPFLMAGAGYLRELHEGNELMETGRSFHGGAGVNYWLTQGRRRLALRGEALIVVRDGAFGSDDRRRAHPSLGATLGYLF
jgi:hypothetical protein